MAWPKGKPRPPGAGRALGTPNKDKANLLELCDKHGLNVFEAMIMATMTEGNPDKYFHKLSELAQYLYPKRRATDLNIQEMSNKDLADEVRNRIQAAKIVNG